MAIDMGNSGPEQYWRFVCQRYPEMHALSTFFRRAPDIAQRYGLVYCKSEWWRGPDPRMSTMSTDPVSTGSVATMSTKSIRDIGVEAAVRHIMGLRKISHQRVFIAALEMMPLCKHPGCQPKCRNTFMPISSAHQSEAS